MTKIICENVLQLQLEDLKKEIEVCDKSGRILGRFLPEAVYGRLTKALADQEFTDEELTAAEQQPGGRTTAEVLERLKAQ
jgi:hypothetical protein